MSYGCARIVFKNRLKNYHKNGGGRVNRNVMGLALKIFFSWCLSSEKAEFVYIYTFGRSTPH